MAQAMSNNYIFSLTPTFTQGLVLGQLSILVLLSLILKYLFLQVDSEPLPSQDASSYTVAYLAKEHVPTRDPLEREAFAREQRNEGTESAEWFNLLLRQVVETYRSKLRDNMPGLEGDEIARQRIERFANTIRPEGLVDPISILSVELGSSSPHVHNARLVSKELARHERIDASFDMTYTDNVSISLSTSVLFHYPLPYFVRLPITLTVSLSLFSSGVTLTPPDPMAADPTLTISLPPSFTLDLKTTSLMGSRAKLANVPKLHELIHSQIRRVIAERGTWKIVMPWVARVDEVKEEVSRS